MALKKFTVRPKRETWVSDWERNQWDWANGFINKHSPSDLSGIQVLVSQPNFGAPYNFYVWCRQGPKGPRYKITLEKWTGPTMIEKLLGNPNLRVLAFYTDGGGGSHIWILQRIK